MRLPHGHRNAGMIKPTKPKKMANKLMPAMPPSALESPLNALGSIVKHIRSQGKLPATNFDI